MPAGKQGVNGPKPDKSHGYYGSLDPVCFRGMQWKERLLYYALRLVRRLQVIGRIHRILWAGASEIWPNPPNLAEGMRSAEDLVISGTQKAKIQKE